MSTWWNPRRLHKKDDTLFKVDDSQDYVVKSATPIERQREMDGTLHSSMRGACLSPPDYVYLNDPEIVKSKEEPKTGKPALNPDEVVKAFLA